MKCIACAAYCIGRYIQYFVSIILLLYTINIVYFLKVYVSLSIETQAHIQM